MFKMFLPNKISHILLSVSSSNVNVFDKLLASVHTYIYIYIYTYMHKYTFYRSNMHSTTAEYGTGQCNIGCNYTTLS